MFVYAGDNAVLDFESETKVKVEDEVVRSEFVRVPKSLNVTLLPELRSLLISNKVKLV